MNKPVQVTITDPMTVSSMRSSKAASSPPRRSGGSRLASVEGRAARVEWLRQALTEGENSGPSVPFDPEDLMTSVRERWKSVAKVRLAPPHDRTSSNWRFIPDRWSEDQAERYLKQLLE